VDGLQQARVRQPTGGGAGTPLVFGEPAPDSVVLAGALREVHARLPHRELGADLLRLGDRRERGARRTDRKAQFRVLAAAGCASPPAALVPARSILLTGPEPRGRSLPHTPYISMVMFTKLDSR
jgi:hypothetical protein